ALDPLRPRVVDVVLQRIDDVRPGPLGLAADPLALLSLVAGAVVLGHAPRPQHSVERVLVDGLAQGELDAIGHGERPDDVVRDEVRVVVFDFPPQAVLDLRLHEISHCVTSRVRREIGRGYLLAWKSCVRRTLSSWPAFRTAQARSARWSSRLMASAWEGSGR